MARKTNNSTPFGRFVKSRRTALKMTLLEVADAMKAEGWPVSYATVAHWESESKPVMPKEFLKPGFVRALAKVLQTTPVLIFDECGYLEGLDEPLDTRNALINSLVRVLFKLTLQELEAVATIVQRFAR